MRPWIAVIAILACSDSSSPDRLVPAIGSYSYSMAIPNRPGLISARTYTGTMTISYATADSLAGSWSVPSGLRPDGSTVGGYRTPLELGQWNEGAYVVWAQTIATGTVVHRLTPQPGGFACEGGILIFGPSGNPLDFQRVDGVCEVRLR